MAKTLKSVRFIDLFFFIILVANLGKLHFQIVAAFLDDDRLLILLICNWIDAEMTPGVEAKVCKRYSKTWRGPCFSISNCNKQCKKKEKAVSGSCHADDVGWACFCYVNC